jgi:hypothetical protein
MSVDSMRDEDEPIKETARHYLDQKRNLYQMDT